MAKTEPLPGMGRVKDKEIEKAAEDYRTKRDARMAMLKEEIAAKKVITDLLHAKGMSSYEYEVDGDDDPILLVAELTTKENLRVRTKKDEADDADEEGDEEAAE